MAHLRAHHAEANALWVGQADPTTVAYRPSREATGVVLRTDGGARRAVTSMRGRLYAHSYNPDGVAVWTVALPRRPGGSATGL